MISVYTDGASRGNPGRAASAYIIVKDDNIIKKSVSYLGTATNNTAEYEAIIAALKDAKNYSKIVKLYSDSEIVIKQLKGEYKVNLPHLKIKHEAVMNLIKDFESVTFEHVRRSNKFVSMCDELCNNKLDEASLL